MERIALKDEAWVDHDPAWLAPAEADAMLAALLEAMTWEHRDIVVFGRPIPQPRLIAWAGDLPYRYSGQTLEPRAAPPVLSALQARIEEAVGARFNHVLLNRYRDGRDHMARHADNEPELGRCPLIAALSLGVPRRFVLERKHGRTKRTLMLAHGSLMVMGGTCQHTWRHAVPRMATVTGERVNLTLRLLHGPPGWRTPRPERAPAAPREAGP
ncbi:MAG: alpha-ketoglutarate-dependent dioxygenase AlkB [Alphaproteobacteria bacterium]|nr:alpha-ketoglutarate-dependent dioxygenase AlkB [Alphaproteobacteria bacterium]